MPAPLLATKLYLPAPRSKSVARPRLIERLTEGLRAGHKLLLISASAGSGKTTLLSEWIAACQASPERQSAPSQQSDLSHVQFSWLSLDEADSAPDRFLAYLVAALQSIHPTLGQALQAALQLSQPPPAETLLADLVNEIAARPGPFVLVLDDYHLVDSKEVDGALTFLVDHQPPQMHLVIASREDPPLPLARLRARGQLTELRAADLRFTPAEAAEFLNQVMGLNLSEGDIAALETRTEGWIAGLQLASLALQGTLSRQEAAAGFIQAFTGSHHFVLDYLLEEVLQRQPEPIQAFLLRTSILKRLCAPLCDAVLGHRPPSAQETLESLDRANLFMVPLDQERRWYRYHHLFGDLLRQRLGRPQEFASYHLRASVWYEANDDLAEAFHHALAAGDVERAARLAEAAWQGMNRSFQTAAWLGWVQKLPDAVVFSRPGLCVQLAWSLSDAGELEASEIHLQYAERALAGAPDQDEAKSLPGKIALIRASNAQSQGDLAETVKYAELSFRLIPEDDSYLRAAAAITLGFTRWAAGNLEASLQACRAWREAMQRLGNHAFVIASAFAVADMQVIMGRLDEAEKVLRQAIQQAAWQGREAETVTAHHHLGLALLAHERGDEAATARHLQTAADLGQRTTLVDWLYRWSLARARLKESAGEWEAALELLDEARRVYIKNAVPILQPVEARKARLYLRQGRLDQAQAWARERGISPETEVRYLDEYDHLTLARVRLAEGAFAGISTLLERLLALAEMQKRTGSVIEILVTQALAHQAQSNRPGALAALEHALGLAEPEGYLRLFVDEGEPMRLLLLDFRSNIEKQPGGRSHPLWNYAERLLPAFDQPAQKQAVVRRGNSERLEPLSERELEVLRLIAEGRSNAEIGQRLYLALSTVKGHNLRIFNKLQVQNRTEAVARARELGLL